MTLLDLVFFATAAACLAGVAFSVQVRLAGARRLGEVLGSQAGSQRLRVVALALLAAVLLLGLLTEPTMGLAGLLAVLSAVIFTGFRPGFGDRVCGVNGVRRGWVVRSFEELEEWRLIGEHLRFRLFGEWEAVPLDPEHHAAIRARLTELVPGRESAFGHGLEHPDRREAVEA